jgi:fatty acid desaturase
MPRLDPHSRPAGFSRKRLLSAIRWVALFALAIAILAVLLVTRNVEGWHPHMILATGAGMFVAVLLAGTLMLLIFFSSSSGYDDEAAHFEPENDDQ